MASSSQPNIHDLAVKFDLTNESLRGDLNSGEAVS